MEPHCSRRASTMRRLRRPRTKANTARTLGAGVCTPVIDGTGIVDDNRKSVLIVHFHKHSKLWLTPETKGVNLRGVVFGATRYE